MILIKDMPQNDECWLFTGSCTARGYGQVRLDGVAHYAHRLSFQLFYGRSPQGLEVCHRCDTPTCINPFHLFLGTHKENMADMKRKGRCKNQTSYGRSKFSDEDILNIRIDFANGMSTMDLVAKYGTSQPYLYQVTRYLTRKNLIPAGLSAERKYLRKRPSEMERV